MILVFTVLHIAYIDTPFVNLEWLFRDGAQYFLTGNQKLLDSYFFMVRQIHSPTLILLVFLLKFLKSIIIHSIDYQLYLVVFFPAIILAKKELSYLVIIVALNPLVWIYFVFASTQKFLDLV